MAELKTIKEALAEMKTFLGGGQAEHVTDHKQFLATALQILESLNFKVDELERQIGPGDAFISIGDIPHRLK